MNVPQSTTVPKMKPRFQLPSPAVQTLLDNFAGRKVAMAREMENGLIGKSFNIVFTNGDELEFDGNGQWKEIICRTSPVPSSLLPSAIARYTARNYPAAYVTQIFRYGEEYDVELSTGLMLSFNDHLRVVEIVPDMMLERLDA